MSGRRFAGGCLCGAVRFRVYGPPETVPYCHCRDCRRWTGAPATAFAGYLDDRVEITRGGPKVYESSPGVRRSFCGDCGASLTYEDERLPGEIYVSIGVFDDPEVFRPGGHSWDSQRLGWYDVADDLPRYEKSSRPR